VLLVSDCNTGSVEFAKVLKSARKVIETSILCFVIVGSWSVCMRMLGCGV
jgi:predicted secreted protein